MLPFPSFDHNSNILLREPCLVNVLDGGESVVNSSSRSEKKSTEACKSHKEAERRRRQRINAHLSTLRTLLPNTIKTDKASLLAEVVRHVKELRNQATTHMTLEQNYWPFPGESDEVTLSYCEDEAKKTARVSICCDDRPGLNRDLSRAIRSAQARVVRAEMMTVGGRTKSVVVVQWGSGGGEEDVEVLRKALKSIVDTRGSGCSSGLGHMVHGSKRVRGYGLS